MFDCVVAADLDWGIGRGGALPWPKLRGDLQHFKRVTTAVPSAVIMGRKTWMSAEIAGRPLPKRRNVVLSRGALEVPDGVIVAGSLDVGLAAARAAAVEATFVIGGAAVFRAALKHPDLRWIYLTRISAAFFCDVIVPNLDRTFERDPWEGAASRVDNGLGYEIVRLRRRRR